MRIKSLLILVSIILFLSLMSLYTFNLAISESVIQNCKYMPNSIEIYKQFELFTNESWAIITNGLCIVKIHLSFLTADGTANECLIHIFCVNNWENMSSKWTSKIYMCFFSWLTWIFQAMKQSFIKTALSQNVYKPLCIFNEHLDLATIDSTENLHGYYSYIDLIKFLQYHLTSSQYHIILKAQFVFTSLGKEWL